MLFSNLLQKLQYKNKESVIDVEVLTSFECFLPQPIKPNLVLSVTSEVFAKITSYVFFFDAKHGLVGLKASLKSVFSMFQWFHVPSKFRVFAKVAVQSLIVSLAIVGAITAVFASMQMENYAQAYNKVDKGIDYYKYETKDHTIIDEKAEFDATTYTSGQFETGYDDLIAYSSTPDFLELNFYGDSRPDTSEVDWWFGGRDGGTGGVSIGGDNFFQTCENNGFNDGVYSDTQWNNGNEWVELTATGQTNGVGIYTSEIFDAGSEKLWNSISWRSSRPYGKPLLGNQQVENGYKFGNIDMSDNVLLMHFDEVSGVLSDSSGNQNGGSNIGATYGVDGKLGTALKFDGVDDYVALLQPYTYFTDGITVGSWVKTSDSSGIIISYDRSEIFRFGIGSNGTAGAVTWSTNDGSSINDMSGSTTVDDGQWHFVVATYNVSSATKEIYVDGQLDTTTSWGGASLGNGTERYGFLGTGSEASNFNGSRGPSTWFDGVMDEMFIFDRALSSTEIEDIYLRGANRVNIKVRSCDDPLCLGEKFVGSDGFSSSSSLAYSELSNDSTSTALLVLNDVPDAQYFQYQVTLETDDSNYTPDIGCVKLNRQRRLYRKCFDVDFTNGIVTQDEYQIYLDIDTATLVSAGKMQSDGGDILFTDEDSNMLDYFIADDMNTSSTRIWVKLDNLIAGTTEKVCMYYGNSSAVNLSSREDTFTYSQKSDLYYVVADSAVGADPNYVSYLDSEDSLISIKKPIAGAGEANGTDAIVPKSFAGTEFVYRMDRGTNEFSISSPWCDASVTMENSAGNSISGSPFSISTGKSLNVTTTNDIADGLPDDDMIIIEESGSDCPILVTHHTTTGNDSFVMYPAQTEWYGVGSSSIEIAAMTDGTSVTLYRSSGTSNSYSLDRGDHVYINDPGSDGSDPAHRVVANKPVGVKSIADSDGNESTTFLPPGEMDFQYFIPQDVQYIAVATQTDKSTTVNLWKDGTLCGQGTPDETQSVNPSEPNPGKIYFGDTAEGLEYTAGACLVANNPVFVYYEYEGTDDETNVWGMKQSRQYIPNEPTYSVGSVEIGNWDLGGTTTYSRRLPITISNNADKKLKEYQIKIDMGSGFTDLFANAQTDGGDIRVARVYGNGDDSEFYWLEEYDPTVNDGTLWVHVSEIPNQGAVVYVYYDAGMTVSTTGSEVDTFSYSELTGVFKIVDSRVAVSDLDLISFADDNEVNDIGEILELDEGGMVTVPRTLAQDSEFSVYGPIQVSFDANTTESLIPISYAGKEFVYRVGRDSDVFSFYAPFSAATVEIQGVQGSKWKVLTTVSVAAGSALTVSQDVSNGEPFKIVSDENILAFHRNGSSDSKVLYPTHLAYEEDSSSYELYGVGTNSLYLVAANNGTNATIYRSDGTNTSVTFGPSNKFTYSESGSGLQGTAYGYHIVADGPIGASSYADGDGSETVVFLSQKEFSKQYILSEEAQYFSIVTRDPNVVCRVIGQDGEEIISGPTEMDNPPPQIGGAQMMPYPNRIHIGGIDTSDGALFERGDRLECSEPVYAFFEAMEGGVSDESTWLTWPQARKSDDVKPIIEDPDIVTEQGLYYESGFDSGGSGGGQGVGLEPEAHLEFILDVSSDTYAEHVFWDNVTWEEIINDRSSENGLVEADGARQIEVQVAYGDPSPDCASAVYSAFDSPTVVNLSSSINTTPLYADYTRNQNMVKIPDNMSDHQCLKVRFVVRTGNGAYTPQLNSIDVEYSLPVLLEDQLSLPTIAVEGNFTSESDRVRILKTRTSEVGLDNSESFLSYRGVSNSAVFSDVSFDLYEISTGNMNPQFSFPPFPVVPPGVDAISRTQFDRNNYIAVYFDHKRSGSGVETMDMTYKTDIIGAGGPLDARDFRLIISN